MAILLFDNDVVDVVFLKSIKIPKVAVDPDLLVLFGSGEGLSEGAWSFFSEATDVDKGGAWKCGGGCGTKKGTCEGVSGEERVFLEQGGQALEEVGHVDPPQFGRFPGTSIGGKMEPPIGKVE